MKWLLLVFCTLLELNAQSQSKRIFVYDFNSCFLSEKAGIAGDINNVNPALCNCGIEGESILCANQMLAWPTSFDTLFRDDWTLGFAVRLGNAFGIVDLFSKQQSCNADTSLSIVFRSQDSTLAVSLREGFDEDLTVYAKLKLTSCWQQLFITKNLGQIRIYEDGNLVQEVNTNFLIRLDNKQPLRFNASTCSFQNFTTYKSLLDNVVIAEYALRRNEILDFYSPQQDIITEDTLIFLGASVDLIAQSNCPVSIQWSPASTLNSSNTLTTIATPTNTTNYIARFNDNGCIVIDSILIRVVDKDKLQCNNLKLPTAFTPNNDGINEVFGISNSYLISELKFFDILDRNGGVIASFKDANDSWDGSWNGKKLNPSTYFYKISYTCKNDEYYKSGSFYLMK